MALKNTKEIGQVVNSPQNGFYELNGMNIQDTARQIQTAAGNANTVQNPKSISSPYGNHLAFLKNVTSTNQGIRAVFEQPMMIMYIKLTEAPYMDKSVEFNVHVYNPEDELESQCIKDLKKRTGWKEAPKQVLEMNIDGRTCGLFSPELKCFIPAAGFCDEKIHDMAPMDYLKDNLHIKNRCRAILESMINNGADRNVLGNLLEAAGGSLPAAEIARYKAEMKKEVPADVANYIKAVAAVESPEIACGYMGTNTTEKLLDAPTLINTGANAVIGSEMGCVGENLVLIPPVKDTNTVQGIEYRYGKFSEDSMDEIPEWIEFTGELDGTLYHKIYPMTSEKYKIRRVKNYIDLAYMVPAGIIYKYNYLVKEPTEAFSMVRGELDCSWRVYPEDPGECIAKLESKQYNDKWEIHQRTSRITRMELLDGDGSVLGSIFPEQIPSFKRANNTMYVALDPAGADSVRLAAIAGSEGAEGISCDDMIHAITPIAQKEIEQIIESCTIHGNGKKKHFESLLQTFFPEPGAGGWSKLMVESRIWKPEEKKLFDALKEYPGTMSAAMTGIGVISNPKEMISRSNLKPEEKNVCMAALKSYIGTMLLESVLVLAREGYSIAAGNLEFLISYPENGSGEGVTGLMKKAIKGAIGLVNEFLTPKNRLEQGKNIAVHSESEATAQWHINNPPSGQFMGPMIAAGTPDYGHSTHDYSLRVNDHLYMFSIPYAAQNITNATLARVYEGNPDALMNCFTGGSQELREGAREAISIAMESKQGKLYERLGFILPLNRLFDNCKFSVTGDNADAYQFQVQQIVEAKLNIAIPAYADSIVRAVKTGDLSLDRDVLLAPVGKGSLAINNTGDGFKQNFIDRLKDQIREQLGKDYIGNVELLKNNDVDKISVAQGLIDLKEAGVVGNTAVIAPISDMTEYYLDIVYGTGENEDKDAKQEFRDKLKASDTKATVEQYNDLRTRLYDDAFKVIIDEYSYGDFEKSFNRWGYTGTGDGSFDSMIRTNAKKSFGNLIAEMKQDRKALIMSCPGIEKEMVCGAMIDLVVERRWDEA